MYYMQYKWRYTYCTRRNNPGQRDSTCSKNTLHGTIIAKDRVIGAKINVRMVDRVVPSLNYYILLLKFPGKYPFMRKSWMDCVLGTARISINDRAHEL